jgi:hypothetical protein
MMQLKEVRHRMTVPSGPRDNLSFCWGHLTSSFRGALLREPGIHNPGSDVQHPKLTQGLRIPGLRQWRIPE